MKDDVKPRSRVSLDLHQHLAILESEGLLHRVDVPINKDTELHPLVRCQFVGGIPEDQRRAFLFTNVVDFNGRRYDMPVVVGALAASPRIYSVGMARPIEAISEAWMQAIANPVAPVCVEHAAVPGGGRQGDELQKPGRRPRPAAGAGLDARLRRRADAHRDAAPSPAIPTTASATCRPTGRR